MAENVKNLIYGISELIRFFVGNWKNYNPDYVETMKFGFKINQNLKR